MNGQVGNNGRPQEGKTTNEERTRILRELQGSKCFCGAKKRERETFCRGCYYALPRAMQIALYKRLFDGYEEAYAKAREFLRERDNPALTRID